MPPVNVSKPSDPEAELVDAIAGFDHDPLGFVMFAFEWGQGELAGHEGPLDWQREILSEIGKDLSPDRALRLAVASGHGIGKSALVSWIILWSLSTCVDTIGVVTANTGDQLKQKTWVQLSKWHRLAINAHWFAVTSKAIFSVDPEHEKTWRIDAVTWNETRTEAFAGLHNEGKRIVLLYDEASGIPDVIWDVSTGALTDRNTEIIWPAFGNPTRNTGRFRECFVGGRFAHRWNPRQIDSRQVSITNKEEIAEWIEDYGEDSDFVRVRVRGIFPRAGTSQFISSDLVNAAADPRRDASGTLYDALVLGVDVARFGDDKSVLRVRRGRDARSIAPLKYRGLDTMQLAAKIAELHERYQFDAIFVDGGGLGAGVVDRCRYLRLPVTDVQFGAKADRDEVGNDGRIAYANKRAEIWGVMREWLAGGMIDDDPELKADLTAVEYGYTMRDGRDAVILERKEHMKKRGLASPDDGDALALTFAYPVAPSDHSAQFSQTPIFSSEYNPYAR
ncbi:MAG TPA: terminase [Bradyrhizobium sp.]